MTGKLITSKRSVTLGTLTRLAQNTFPVTWVRKREEWRGWEGKGGRDRERKGGRKGLRERWREGEWGVMDGVTEREMEREEMEKEEVEREGVRRRKLNESFKW
jgi:hypothetical protein